MGRLITMVGLLFIVCLGIQTVAAEVFEHNTPQQVVQPSEQQQLDQNRLDLEREKFEHEKSIDCAKLEEERNRTFWLAIATAVPLLATFVALIVGIFTARTTLQIHRDEAKLQFDLKTAEIIFSGVSHEAIHNRARSLKEYFGDRLSDAEKFTKEFKPEDYENKKESPESKRFFCGLLLEHPDVDRKTIVDLWFELFPQDYSWLARIDPTIWEKVPQKLWPQAMKDESKDPSDDTA